MAYGIHKISIFIYRIYIICVCSSNKVWKCIFFNFRDFLVLDRLNYCGMSCVIAHCMMYNPVYMMMDCQYVHNIMYMLCIYYYTLKNKLGNIILLTYLMMYLTLC